MTKPVNVITHAVEAIEWVGKERSVYSYTQQKMVTIKYLRPNFIDEYNNGMNNVDQADQLRLVYRYDRWMRKRK